MQKLWLFCALHRRKLLLAGVVFAVSVDVAILFALCLPRTITFSYSARTTCIFSPMVLPGLFRAESDAAFRLSRPDTIGAFGVGVFSARLCSTPTGKNIPKAQTTYAGRELVRIGSIPVFSHSATTQTEAYPTASTLSLKPLATNRTLEFPLDKSDETFSYALVATKTEAPCTVATHKVQCGLAPLQLAYSTTHTITLERRIGTAKAGTVLQQKLTTISATTITKSSVAAVVYDKPTQIILQADKQLAGASGVKLLNKTTNATLAARTEVSGQTITVTPTATLPRNTDLVLTVQNVAASDDSTLVQPYELVFHVSGGPRVSGTSTATYGLTSAQGVVVTFDQQLAGGQDAGAIQLLVNGSAVAAKVAYNVHTATISPVAPYPQCAKISVQINGTIQNAYGIAGDSAWTFSSRARCYSTFSIGTSVQGRAITAYKFGSGSSMVLYIGATHGNESNTARLLQKWINTVETNPDAVPAGRSIVVIPQINPDGVAANSRLNARGIDLNRNFPANDWQTNVTLPGSTAITQAGGPTSLSEPESQALASFVQANRPRFVLTFHSRAAIVEANESGDSVALAEQYAKSARYAAMPASQIGNTFDYSTTGSLEEWMHDKLGLPAFVVELYSATDDEFTRNQNGLWLMAKITQ